MIIKLQENSQTLDEVVITPGENPAHPILRNIIASFSIERNSSSDIKLDNSLEDIRTTSKTTDNLLPVSNDSLN